MPTCMLGTFVCVRALPPPIPPYNTQHPTSTTHDRTPRTQRSAASRCARLPFPPCLPAALHALSHAPSSGAGPPTPHHSNHTVIIAAHACILFLPSPSHPPASNPHKRTTQARETESVAQVAGLQARVAHLDAAVAAGTTAASALQGGLATAMGVSWCPRPHRWTAGGPLACQQRHLPPHHHAGSSP